MKSLARMNGMQAAGNGLGNVDSVTDYRTLSKVFHWLTAALVFVMVSSGVIAKQLDSGEVAGTLLTLHKTTGILTLVVVVMRLVYRVTRFDPVGSPRRDRRPVLHWVLYGTILLVPLLGWAGVSDSERGAFCSDIRCPPSGRKARAMPICSCRCTPTSRSPCWRWWRSISERRCRTT
jgi:cytochrome b561